MSRVPSLVSLLGATLALPLATAPAQTLKQPVVPPVTTQFPNASQFGPASTGTGAYQVWIGEPQNNQSFSLGTASSLVFQNGAGLAVQPTSGVSGSVRIYFAPNNTMWPRAVQQSCYAQRNCAGPGWPVVIFRQNLPGGAVTLYTAQGVTSMSFSGGVAIAGASGGVVSFQRLFVQTLPPPPEPPASQTGRVNPSGS
jgi:hypothetical protein